MRVCGVGMRLVGERANHDLRWASLFSIAADGQHLADLVIKGRGRERAFERDQRSSGGTHWPGDSAIIAGQRPRSSGSILLTAGNARAQRPAQLGRCGRAPWRHRLGRDAHRPRWGASSGSRRALVSVGKLVCVELSLDRHQLHRQRLWIRGGDAASLAHQPPPFSRLTPALDWTAISRGGFGCLRLRPPPWAGLREYCARIPMARSRR